MTLLIGIFGPAGAGKSSVANYLVEKYGAKRYSFATALKLCAQRTLDFTDEQVFGTQAQKETIDPRYGFTPRWFLQRLGTEGCRKTFGEDFWVKQTMQIIYADKQPIAVIDDARFLSEADAVHNFALADIHHSSFWRLESPGRETSDPGTHASEREWMDVTYDMLLKPTARGLDELFALVDGCMQELSTI